MKAYTNPEPSRLGQLLRRASEAAAPSEPDFLAFGSLASPRVRPAPRARGLRVVGLGLGTLAATLALAFLVVPRFPLAGNSSVLGDSANANFPAFEEARGVEVEVGLYVEDLLSPQGGY